MQNFAVSRCCFETFCNWQRNEQRITNALTPAAIVVVVVAVKFRLIKFLKTEYLHLEFQLTVRCAMHYGLGQGKR